MSIDVGSRFMSALVSALPARTALARGLGQMFNGHRNLYETFGYARVLNYTDKLERYARQDIVSRIVNAYPDALWARPPQFLENPTLAENMQDLNNRLSLFHYLNRVDRLAGIGRYAVLLFGFDDVKDNEGLASPVRRGCKLNYLQAYGEGVAEIVAWEDNAASPAFGLPKLYRLRVAGDAARQGSSLTGIEPNGSGALVDVHRTRVLHVADCLLDQDVYGYPILDRIYNRLDDSEKVVGGAAEVFWLSGRKGMQIDVDKDTKFTKDDAKKLRQELDDFGNDLQRYIRTKGVTIKDLGGQHINPEPVFNVIMSMISIATGIPQRIFIGSEQGKLASEQDRANWAIRINERRELYAGPRIIRPLVSALQSVGVVAGGPYKLEWPEAFQMSPLERGQTAAQQARAATNVVRAAKDMMKPVEGVDYPILRPTASVGGGGAFGRGLVADSGAKKPSVESKKTDAPQSGKEGQPKSGPGADKGGGVGSGAGTPPAPKPIPMESITIPERVVLSLDEMRQIIFARGELKTEGKIDGVAD